MEANKSQQKATASSTKKASRVLKRTAKKRTGRPLNCDENHKPKPLLANDTKDRLKYSALAQDPSNSTVINISFPL